MTTARHLRHGAQAILLGLAVWVPTLMAGAAPSTQTLVCDVVYLPSRANWLRTVTVDYDERRLRGVAVDGVAVHSFAVSGTVILTSQDNERIQLDVDQLAWTSDFRGLATGQGRCQREKT
jgi:hypothetical protein